MSEQVLVFPTTLLKDMNYEFEGFRKIKSDEDHKFVDNLLLSDKLFYMDREAAEKDPNFKQLIPYCILIQNGEIFCYKRTKKGGEKRLHELWSVGVGGHINPCDGEGAISKYEAGLFRELKEEVDIKKGYSVGFFGFINDNSNSVGQVHFGVVHEIILDSDATLSFNDPALSNGDFETRQNVLKNLDSFENWSKLLLTEYLTRGFDPDAVG